MIMNVLGIEPAAVCLGDIAFAMWIRGALWEYRVHGKNLLVFSDVAALSSLLPNFMFAYIFVRDARRRLGLDVSFRCDPPRWRSYLHLSLKIFKIGGMSVWMIVFALWQKRLLQDLYVAYCTQLSRNIIFTLPKTRGKLEKRDGNACHNIITIHLKKLLTRSNSSPLCETVQDCHPVLSCAVEVSQPLERMVG